MKHVFASLFRTHPLIFTLLVILLFTPLLAVLLPARGNAQEFPHGCAACFPMQKNLSTEPLGVRILPATDCIINYLAEENKKDGIPLTPVPAQTDPVFTKALQSILKDLSAPLRTVLKKQLAGIYLVRNLGSSGFTEEFLDANGQRRAFIALDAAILLQNPANQWATWKENSAFLPSPAAKLKMTLEPDDADTHENAIRFILLHELGHALGYICGAHPAVSGLETASFQDYPFIPLSWQKQDGRIQSRFDGFFPERGQLRFYGAEPKRFHLSDAPELYKKVAKTNFPSLYGSLSIHEDFAESFATYMHVIRGRRPWLVEVTASGQAPVTLFSCFADGGCPGKKQFFDDFFQNP